MLKVLENIFLVIGIQFIFALVIMACRLNTEEHLTEGQVISFFIVGGLLVICFIGMVICQAVNRKATNNEWMELGKGKDK